MKFHPFHILYTTCTIVQARQSQQIYTHNFLLLLICLCASFIIIKAACEYYSPENHPQNSHCIGHTAFLILLKYSFFACYAPPHTACLPEEWGIYNNNNNKSARRQNLHYTIYLLYPKNFYCKHTGVLYLYLCQTDRFQNRYTYIRTRREE